MGDDLGDDVVNNRGWVVGGLVGLMVDDRKEVLMMVFCVVLGNICNRNCW